MIGRRNAMAVCLALVGGLAVAGPSFAQTTFRMNEPFPEDSHFGVAVDVFAKQVEELTNGRYHIENYYSGTLGAERESVEAVQLGSLDLTFTSTGPVPNFVPEVSVLDIPFLFKDYPSARAVLDGPIGDELLATFDAHGMHALAWAENGFRNMTNNKHPILTPADLQGLKMRTMENPIHIQAYQQFGISPTPMAITQVFEALQQGVVDGQENPLSVILTNRFDEVQKYLSMTGHVYAPAVFLMNGDLWAGLSDEDKAAFTQAAKVAAVANRERVDADEAEGIARLRASGVEVEENIDKQAFVDALAPVYVEFHKRFDPLMQQIIDAQN